MGCVLALTVLLEVCFPHT